MSERNNQPQEFDKYKFYAVLVLIAIFAGIFIAVKISSKTRKPEPEQHPTFVENLSAAQTTLADYLKSPSTAKYSYYEEDWQIVTNDNKRVKMESFVDAQNSFGSTIRSDFTIIITWRDDYESFTINYVQIDDDVYLDN